MSICAYSIDLLDIATSGQPHFLASLGEEVAAARSVMASCNGCDGCNAFAGIRANSLGTTGYIGSTGVSRTTDSLVTTVAHGACALGY